MPRRVAREERGARDGGRGTASDMMRVCADVWAWVLSETGFFGGSSEGRFSRSLGEVSEKKPRPRTLSPSQTTMELRSGNRGRGGERDECGEDERPKGTRDTRGGHRDGTDPAIVDLTSEDVARLRAMSNPIKPVNAWFPVDPDEPNTKNPIRDATTADAARDAFSKYYLKVEFKRVKWESSEVFLYEGKKGCINGSPHFFCGKCTGVWSSHDYPPDERGRAQYRLVRRCCKFCGAKGMQEEVLRSTGLG